MEDRTAPAVLSVNTLTDGVIDHTNSVLTLREAVAVVSSGSLSGLSAGEANQIFGNLGDNDTIQFEVAGTISLNQSELILDKDVVITGPGTGALTIERSASASSAFRIFEVQGGSTNVTIEKLTIARGAPTAGETGGGILNLGFLTVQYVTMTQNTVSGTTGYGGAIENIGTLYANFSTFSGNSAARGGGIDQDNSAAVTFINNCTFSVNTAVLSSGTGGDGGGLANNGLVNVVNSTFSGNSADNNGGGIHNNGTIVITGATVVLNTADSDSSSAGSGGGIFGNITTSIFNTIVAGNTRNTISPSASDISGAIAASSANNVIGNPASAGGLTAGTNGNQTGFAIAAIVSTTLANNGGLTNTHALVQNSPALGTGSNAVTNYKITDQREAGRDNNSPDVGAYESHHPLSPVGVPGTYERTFQPKPSADANTAFVKGLYQSTLLRAPDAGGLAAWAGILNSGAQTRTQVATGFYNSVENRSNQVTSYYHYFLGRDPDPTGLNGWVLQLQTGVDEGTVMVNFVLSPEFSGLNDNSSFVNLMYYAILSRQADTVGFNGWKNALDNGTLTREQEVNGFLRSVEGLGRVVSSFFVTYLKRVPDAATQSAFVSQLQNGATFTSIAVSLLGSDELFGQAQNNLS